MHLRLASLLLLSCVTACAPAAPAPPPQSALPSPPALPSPGRPLPLPTRFMADRFFVEPITTSGARLLLYTDTGGGLFLTRSAVERLGLPTEQIAGDEGLAEGVRLPPFKPEASIPPVTVLGGHLGVASKDKKACERETSDGMLGQAWFQGRTWTFDYPGRRLLLRATGDLPAHDASHRVSLGFPMNEAGTRATNFPRIQAQIDGQTVDLLFDTGATVNLTDQAAAALADGGPVVRATSFIVQSTFDRWRQDHPEWRVIEGADLCARGEPMIEVPRITVAGHEVGPVWFVRRRDANFHEWMSQWMDKRVDGALGGSALHDFRVTVDYPSAVAVFERP
ncbi:hypothetical protein [Polyangium sp. 15x6]|uniref:hypothetical protein n=1 Tax=Polyangium sp. 15x6 TaxID=3042687 RepID=UPI00249C0F40|nr:hypothetical protein [Polyangium sp. 15x6]MDI3285477.1 hypothetical protein [Polyangium sp. 15x6]